MAKGEKKFSTSGREARKFTSEPFAAGDYGLKLLGETVEINKKQDDPKAFSYVKCAFEALGTGEEGKRNRRVYHNFFLKLTPGKDGSLMTDRADQIVGLAKASGEDINVGMATQNGEDVVSAADFAKWLKANDGLVVQGHVKVRRGQKGKDGTVYADKNEIEYFIESEDAEDAEEEEIEETEEEGEESDEESDEEDTDEDEEVEDEKPAKKAPAKKGKR